SRRGIERSARPRTTSSRRPPGVVTPIRSPARTRRCARARSPLTSTLPPSQAIFAWERVGRTQATSSHTSSRTDSRETSGSSRDAPAASEVVDWLGGGGPGPLAGPRRRRLGLGGALPRSEPRPELFGGLRRLGPGAREEIALCREDALLHADVEIVGELDAF